MVGRKCSSVPGILLLIGRNFVVLVAVAFLIATPIAWIVMNNWLESFAHRIRMSLWIFALPGAVVVLIAMFTISFHTIQAARANPAHSLRYE